MRERGDFVSPIFMADHDGRSQDPRLGLLDRVFNDLILKKFNRQPRWLQAFVYFLFVMFFLTTAFRLVAGDYVVSGVLWEGGRHPRDYEIRIGTGFFTSNSKGVYYVVLGPSQYARLVLTRSMTLRIVRPVLNKEGMPIGDEEKVGNFTIALQGWSLDDFEDLDLKSPGQKVTSTAPAMNFELISSAYAQTTSRNDRLYIQSITLGATSQARAGKFKLELKDGGKVPLLVGGATVGEVPLRSGVPVSFDGRYYFDIPLSQRGQRVQILYDDKGGFFYFGDNEDFFFEIPKAPGTFKARGTRASKLVLTLVPAGNDIRKMMTAE